ncbi:SIMPL domain-containing protein [Endozoicomonas sp. G2_1]|uniref:SIMPL domain-containing protein n=1 Tax=Endozoicomonas sp. G2_1 TaxID=2821091 RepID=UPI001ADD0BED|nr:SIMPL domain-containing protein [Endozoicomonas sp. G2_1]MBO9488908.1 SIMPL domain-containing protein [Endozoicomonas sp. G2_1]
MDNKSSGLVFSALLVASGIASAGYFISETLYKSRVALNTAVVKGLAERKVTADKAFWSISYTVTGSKSDDIAQLYRDSESDQKKIVELLKQVGFSSGEIKLGVINYVKEEFRDENQKLVDEKHVLVGEVEVQTNNVQLVSQGRAKLNTLIAQGLDLKNYAPTYHFTKLNDIKPEMLKEATTNARLAANEFATNAGVKVGGIRSAVQGGFVIRDIGENYGDTRKIEKNVRVVTNVTFLLTD